MRSMPIQFWPEDWNVPRMRMLAMPGRREGELSRIMAGSLPPSSRTRGVRDLEAEDAMWCATGREPMNVMWEI